MVCDPPVAEKAEQPAGQVLRHSGWRSWTWRTTARAGDSRVSLTPSAIRSSRRRTGAGTGGLSDEQVGGSGIEGVDPDSGPFGHVVVVGVVGVGQGLQELGVAVGSADVFGG